MFLKSLRIENSGGIIRDIQFNAGLNLIVDETPTDQLQSTGNNVGKDDGLEAHRRLPWRRPAQGLHRS